MTRRESIAAILGSGTPKTRPSKRKHHAGEQIYHGPMSLPPAVIESASRASVVRTASQHLAIRLSRDGVVYLFRYAPAPEMVGEIWRTPEGNYRVHCWAVSTSPIPVRAALDRIERDRTPQFPIMPPMSAPTPAWREDMSDIVIERKTLDTLEE